MRNLIVFTAVLALALLGSAGVANAGSWDGTTTMDKVGIGTTSPGNYKLHITGGDIMFNQIAGRLQLWTEENYFQIWDNQFKFVTNAGQGFTFNGGNVYFDRKVGIGTRDPGYKLHITGGDIMFDQPAGRLQLWTESNYLQLWDNQFKFVTNAVKGFTFNGGNVGIGTDDPQAKLDVDGDIYATDDKDTVSLTDDTLVSVVDLYRRIAVLEATPPEAQLLARLKALEAIVQDLPPGLRNIDRNGDGK